MKYQVPGTIAFYRASPYFQMQKIGNFPVVCMAQRSKLYYEEQQTNKSLPLPDDEAINFYCQNQLVATIHQLYTPYERLPEWARSIMESYNRTVAEQTERLLFYALMICTRESRHNGYSNGSEWMTAFSKSHGTAMAAWFSSLKGGGSAETAGKFRDMKGVQGSATEYTKAMSVLFHTGSFGGSYGGHPWGVIADTIHSFMEGTTTAEMFIDTAYTLAHNNGPMFNKGMLYKNYSSTFMRILDVQRSGQVPEYVLQYVPVSGVNVRTLNCLKLFKEALPGVLGEYVDWIKVQALGALHTYPVEIAMQKKMHGDQPPAKITPTTALQAPESEDSKLVYTGSKFNIMPFVSVDIVERVS